MLRLFKTISFICALLLCQPVFSQLASDSPIGISDNEKVRYQAILDEPVDMNTSYLTRTTLYRQKVFAAFKLGDNSKREEYLRAWAEFSPDEGKWNLMSYLAMTEKRPEAFEIGKELIQSIRYAPSAARIRIQMAGYYIDNSDLKEAARLLEAAGNLIRFDMRNMNRAGATQFWIARAEVDFHICMSRLMMRQGKWADGIENAKIAVEKTKALMSAATIAPNENERQWAYSSAVWATQELASQQMLAGLYADAEWSLRDAYKQSKELGFNERHLVGFYNRVADLYNATGQFKEAEKFAERSEKLILEQGYQKGSPIWLYNRLRSNAALVGDDRWKDAAASYDAIDQETARLGQSAKGVAHQTLLRSYVYLKTDRTDAALRLIRGNMRWNIDNFGEDHYFTAINRGMFAVGLSKTGNDAQARTEFGRALGNLVSPDSLTGDYVESAIQRKIKRFIMQGYMQLLVKTAATNQKDAEIIFQVADQLNSSKVQQALSEAAVRSGVTIPGLADIIRKEQDAKNEIASLTNYISGQGSEDDKRRTPQIIEQMRLRLREIEGLRKTYKAQIQKEYPDYFQLIQPKPPSHLEIAKQLKPDELFIAIIPLEDKTYVWAIDGSGKIDFQSAALSEKDLGHLVDRVRKTLDVAGLGSRAPAFDQASAYKIYKEIFGGFDKQIESKKHLIVSTSGSLAQLPFAVLPRTPAIAGAQPSWLLKDVAVSHVPTANGWLSLKRLGQQPVATEPLLAWGDPLFDAQATQQGSTLRGSTVRSAVSTRSAGDQQRTVMGANDFLAYSKIPPLPETRDEVIELANILSANIKEDLVLGADATRASVIKHNESGRLAKKQVVVFATHGLLAGDLPYLNQPALAMAATKNTSDSPLLTLEDVLALKLNADWVVLSACNTAGADGRAEEALSGLARGFFYAGGRSLLVTHWSVESESAMMLTTHTFAAYKKNPQMRRSEALRQAMLETMKDSRFTHPAYWAPYALVGEGGR